MIAANAGNWNADVDVVVVGFGGAGACAALEAKENGASVLVLDLNHGGGATAASGGVIYAGGGTKYQQAAGFEDTPEEMYRYLKQEGVGKVVSDETLRRFCEESKDMISWLEKAGVPFEASLCPFKTSYPTDKYYLYFSGNEKCHPYKEHAKPAPRGHRARGRGISGLALFHNLEKTVRQRGIQVKLNTRIDNLIFENGQAVGVQGRAMTPVFGRIHGSLCTINGKANTWAPPVGKLIRSLCNFLFKTFSKPYRARARKGIILCAGGFIFNKPMVREHNKIFRQCSPLGTYGDDGTGIQLGVSAGGTTAHMDRMTAWRFYVPPDALMQGILVNKKGERLCPEDYYGAKQGDYIVADGGSAFLIFDSKTYKQAVSLIGKQCALFQKITMIPMLRVTRKKASTLAALAAQFKIDPKGLEETMAKYNAAASKGEPDPLGKSEERFIPQDTPPFYAVDCSLRSKSGIPTAAMTLGGLVVDENTGQVVGQDGKRIQGIYAAGRNAIGICSNGYFASGLSIADGIFAARRAGRHAATYSKAEEKADKVSAK